MSFTSVYSAGPEERERQKKYEADIGDAYQDWLSNKEIHMIPRPSMGLNYKEINSAQIKAFLSTFPEYIKVTYTIGWKQTKLKRTQVWSGKKRVEGKFILCVYQVNCTIMKVQHFQTTQFVLSKPRQGKKGRVIVMPMSGGRGNRKSLMGVLSIERITHEEEYTDRPDEEAVSDYFFDIIEAVWKESYNEKPTVDLRLLQQNYKKYLDYKYELTQFRKIMKARGDTKSETLGNLPLSQRETTPPASPSIGQTSGETSGAYGPDMEDSSNLYKNLEDKKRVLMLIRADIYDKLAGQEVDDQDMHYIENMPVVAATLFQAVIDHSMTLEKCNIELDELHLQLINIAESRGFEIPHAMVAEWDRVRKRWFQDESDQSLNEPPSKKKGRVINV